MSLLEDAATVEEALRFAPGEESKEAHEALGRILRTAESKDRAMRQHARAASEARAAEEGLGRNLELARSKTLQAHVLLRRTLETLEVGPALAREIRRHLGMGSEPPKAWGPPAHEDD